MTAPILPIVPIDQLNNYCWKDWEEWYQSCRIEVGSPVALTEAERRPLANSLQTRIFSLLLSHHPQMPVVFACMMDPSDKKVLECCVKWPQTLSSPPVLEGISFENLTNMIDFDQFRDQLLSALDSHGDTTLQFVLLVHGLNSSILKSLGLNSYPSLCIRDTNRFPLQKQSNHIAGIVHDLFVSPNTKITLSNPEQLLDQYLLSHFFI